MFALSAAIFALLVCWTRSNSFCTEVVAAVLSPMMAMDCASRSVAVAAAPMLPMDSEPNISMSTGKRLSLSRPPMASTTFLI